MCVYGSYQWLDYGLGNCIAVDRLPARTRNISVDTNFRSYRFLSSDISQSVMRAKHEAETSHFIRMCGAISPLPHTLSCCVQGHLYVWKVKLNLLLEKRAHGEVEVQLYSFFNLGASWGWLSTPHPSATLSLGNDPVLMCRRLGCLQGWSGQVRKIRPNCDSISGPSSL